MWLRVALALTYITLMMTSSLQCARTASAYFQTVLRSFNLDGVSAAAHNLASIAEAQSAGFLACVTRHSAACDRSIDLASALQDQAVQNALTSNEAFLNALASKLNACTLNCTAPTPAPTPRDVTIDVDGAWLANLSQHAGNATAAASLAYTQALHAALQCAAPNGQCTFGSSLLDTYAQTVSTAQAVHDYNVQSATSTVNAMQAQSDAAFAFIDGVVQLQLDLAAAGIYLGSPPSRPIQLPFVLASFPNVPSADALACIIVQPLNALASSNKHSADAALGSLVDDIDQGPPPLSTAPPLSLTLPPPSTGHVVAVNDSTNAVDLPGALSSREGDSWSVSDPLLALEQLARALDDVASLLVNLDLAARLVHAARVLAKCWSPTRLDLAPVSVDRPLPALLRVHPLLPLALVLVVAYVLAAQAYAPLLDGFRSGCLAPNPTPGTVLSSDLAGAAMQWAAKPGLASSNVAAANATRNANALCAAKAANASALASTQVAGLRALLTGATACNCSDDVPTALPEMVDFNCAAFFDGCAVPACIGPQALAVNATALQTGCQLEGWAHSYILGTMVTLLVYFCLNAARFALQAGLLDATYQARLRARGSRPVAVDWDTARGVVGGLRPAEVDQAVREHDARVRKRAVACVLLAVGLHGVWLGVGQELQF